MTKQDVLELVGDEEKASSIIEAAKDVRSFLHFRSVLSTGVTINHNSIPFDRMMIFERIKDIIDERKTSV